MSWNLGNSDQLSLSSNDPQQITYTCNNNDKLLVVVLFVNDTTARTGGAPTYNSEEFTDSGQGFISGAENSVEIWYLLDPLAGEEALLQIQNDNTREMGVSIMSFAPSSGACVLNNSNSGTGTSANPSITVVTDINNCLMIGGLGSGYRDAPSQGSGYTLIHTDDAGQQTWGSEYDLDCGNAGSITVSFTQSSDDWGMIGIAFNETAAVYNITLSSILNNNLLSDLNLSQEYNDFSLTNILSQSNLETLSLSQEYNDFSLSDLLSQPSIETFNLIQEYAIPISDITNLNYQESFTLNQDYGLSGISILNQNLISEISLTQIGTDTLTVIDLDQNNFIENINLSLESSIEISDINQINLIEAFDLIIEINLILDILSNYNYLQTFNLSQSGIDTLNISEINQLNSISNIILSEEQNIQIENINCKNYLEILNLSQKYNNFQLYGLLNQPSIETFNLEQEYNLNLSNPSNLNYLEDLTLTIIVGGTYTLSISPINSLNLINQLILLQEFLISISDIKQNNYLDDLSLSYFGFQSSYFRSFILSTSTKRELESQTTKYSISK